MKVIWEVEDGYVGKSRPQTTIIPDGELDYAESEDEKKQIIEDYVQDDFDINISWAIVRIEK